MRFSILLTIMAFMGIGIVLAGSAIAKNSSMSVQDFVHRASLCDLFEIQSGKIAIEHAKGDDVKSFAQRMVYDHTKASERLQGILKPSSIKPVSALDDEHQKMIDELKSMPDSNFDNRYIGMQADAHEKAVQLFSDYSQRGADLQLKAFAAEMLPALQDHLREALKMKEAM